MNSKVAVVSLLAFAGVSSVFAALPAGYTELPYLESTYGGNQWVYTDFVPNGAQRIEVKFRIVREDTWASATMFWACGTANNADRSYGLVVLSAGDAKLTPERNDKPGYLQPATGYWPYGTFIPELGTNYTVVVDNPNRTWSINGETLVTSSGLLTGDAGSSLALFGRHNLGSSLSPTSTLNCFLVGRIYYLRVYDANDQVVCNLVPARDDNATAASKYYGFYDTVADKYWPNCGATPFVTDPSYSLTRTLDRADYESDEAAGAALVTLLQNTFAGDRILLTAGTSAAPHVYRIAEPLLLANKRVTLSGGSDDAAATVIDAGGTSAGVIARESEITVEKLTVRRAIGYAADSKVYAGGIALTKANSTIRNCIVRDCLNHGMGSSQLGGGVYLNTSTMADSLVTNCTVSSTQSTTGTTSAYGGGVFCTGGTSAANLLITNCVVVGCQATNTVSWNAVGGGIALGSASYLTLVDCKISANTASKYGGAVYAGGPQMTVRRCELSDNVLDAANPQDATRAGSAILASSCALQMDGCRVARNHAESPSTWYANIGAALYLGAAGTVIRDSVFEGNVGTANGSCIHVSDYASGFTVTNCIFKGNATGKNCGCIYTGGVTTDTLITDSYFIDNSTRTTYPDGTALQLRARNDATICVRNCLMTGNTGGSIVTAFANNGDIRPNYVLENCTIVSNTCTHQSAVWNNTYDSSIQPGDVHLKGCVSLFNKKGGFDSRYTDVKYTCYSSTETTGSSFVDESNVIYDSTKPLFADILTRDFRPAKDSQLMNKVPKADWMGTGRKRSTHDLGSGYEVVTVGTYGVTVKRVNDVPRIYGDKADIGCCEFYTSPGLMLLVR